MVLGRKYPIVYDEKKYYAKLYKYNWHNEECRVQIYKRKFIWFKKVYEVGCNYSEEITDTDFKYFVKEAIRRYLKMKEHENVNKKAFQKWDGRCQ